MPQTQMIRRCLGAVTLFLAFAAIANATQVTLTTASVIGGSGDYNGGAYNNAGDQFSTLNVVNQQTGPISEQSQSGYWLTPNGTPAPTGYFVLDLGASYSLGFAQLFNTHNATYDDRGTGQFTIQASNNLQAGPAGTGFDLLNPVTILSGTLASGHQAVDPLPGQTFGIGNSTAYQYIRFNDVSIGAAADTGFGAAGGGLNEIRLFTTPEPSTFILSGLGLVGLFIAARRCKT